jgi:hypothetical protein
MLGIYILAFFIAIIVVVYWARANDGVPLGGKTKGILQMTWNKEAGSNLLNRTPAETGGAVLKTPGRSEAPVSRPNRD